MLDKFYKYIIAGGIGTLVHYILLTLTVELLAMPIASSTTLGFTAGAVVNYQLNSRFTFRDSSHASFAFGRFLLIAVLGMFLNLAVVVMMIKHTAAHYLVAQLLATVLVLVLGFVLNASWTFRSWPGQGRG